MKKLILSIILASSTLAHSGWVNEVTSGCSMVGAANYALTEGDQTQNLIVGCLIGGSVGYLMKEYYQDKAMDKYESKIHALETQLDDIVTEQNINNSLGIDGTPIKFKKRRLPTKRLKNGSYQLGTFVIEPEVPGSDLVIGD